MPDSEPAGREQTRVGARKSARRPDGRKGSMTTGLTLGVAVAVLALPSAVLAFSSTMDMKRETGAPQLGTVAAPGEGGQIAAAIPVRSLARGHEFRFTPAGMPTRPDRSVTVAVRVDPQSSRMITVRGERLVMPQAKAVGGATPLQIAPTAFSLGVSRGYESFAQGIAAKADSRKPDLRKIEMPDLSALRGAQPKREESRFATRVVIEDSLPTGRAPRTFSGDGQDTVDVAGALRVTRNLDVTAGVRYSQDRERLRPLNDGRPDNQAVYVGTQFRF